LAQSMRMDVLVGLTATPKELPSTWLYDPTGCELLDQIIVSPTKWHRAHVTWFFETFVLGWHSPSYLPFDGRYAYLFNSYYEQAGPRHPRPERGMLSRPSSAEVAAYRSHVDGSMQKLLSGCSRTEVVGLVELGLHH